MKRDPGEAVQAGALASGLFKEVVRRGLAAVRADLERIEEDLAGVTRIELEAPEPVSPLPKARRSMDSPDPPSPARKALPAPTPMTTSRKRWGNYTKPSPLRDAIAEVLRRHKAPLTPCDIGERLRSKAFGYDPGRIADKALRARVKSCLQTNKSTLFESAGCGVGWCLREGK
jgi:hypothetical protein